MKRLSNRAALLLFSPFFVGCDVVSRAWFKEGIHSTFLMLRKIEGRRAVIERRGIIAFYVAV